MRRPRAQCPKSQGIKGHVERDEAVLRYVDRGPSIDRRRRQRRQRVEEEGSSTLGVLRLPGGEMVLVETEPHPETLESLFAEDRKSVVYGKSVSVRVDLGGRRIIKKKKKRKK